MPACHVGGRGFEPLPGRTFIRRFVKAADAGVAQLAEQLICNQQVAGSSPIASFLLSKSTVRRRCSGASGLFMGRFPSGQREQTVNLLSLTSVVRIHPCPPCILREWRNWQTRMIQVHVYVRTCRFKSCFPHQNPLIFKGFFVAYQRYTNFIPTL